MRDLVAAIDRLRPGAEWALRGPSYAELEWLDQAQTKPTLEEVSAAVLAAQADRAAQSQREATYRADASRQDMLTRLKTATPAQIESYIDANVTTLAQARTFLKALTKAIALDLRT